MGTLGVVDIAPASNYLTLKNCQEREAGEAWACTSLVITDDRGEKAEELYRQACNKEGLGCFILGQMYRKGEGVTQDDFKAVELFQKACDGQDASGCIGLGVEYAVGHGVRQSVEDALTFYGKACDLKDANGCKFYAELKAGKK